MFTLCSRLYLHDRFQSISINGETSRRFEVKYGVPQGSCLGLLLFTCMQASCLRLWNATCPMPMRMQTTHNCMCPLMLTPATINLLLLRLCKGCIMDIREWMLSHRLKLIYDKTVLVVMGSRQQLAKVNIDALHVGDCVTPLSIAQKANVRDFEDVSMMNLAH